MNYTYKNLPIIGNKDLLVIKQKLESQEVGKSELVMSFDLHLSDSTVILDFENKSVILENGEKFTIPESFDPRENICYFISDGNLFPMKMFSEFTNFYYALVPTSFRPILRISATQMHKKPFLDYLEKKRIRGVVLDAGTGLGYSAVIVCKTATKIITVEWDPNVIEIAQFNPHSRLLFESDNLELYNDDITEKIKEFEDDKFDNIIHDGGMPKSSGNFFSQSHANELYRVLKSDGFVYFYLPKKGKSKGRDFAMEQIQRMKRSGFRLFLRKEEESFAIFLK